MPVSCFDLYALRLRAHSVTIISTGFLTSISNLLTSPADEFSDLSGTLLVAQKVKELIIMAGQFSDTKEPDYNMSQASSWAQNFVLLWPAEVPVIFNPMEVGEALNYSRHQVCFLYAVEDKSLFNVSSPGYVVIDVADFTMYFHPDETINHYYLKPFTAGERRKGDEHYPRGMLPPCFRNQSARIIFFVRTVRAL